MSRDEWGKVAHRNGPNLFIWVIVCLLATGLMLYFCPVRTKPSWLISSVVVILAFLMFLFAWMAGQRTFALSCESYWRSSSTIPLAWLIPLLLIVLVLIGLIGGGWYWLFAPLVAVVGHRKATKRMWWGTVANLAWVLRNPIVGWPSLADTDEEALVKAIAQINKGIGLPHDKVV